MNKSAPVTIQDIRQFARRPGWSKARLARAAGLHRNTLRDLDNPSWDPRLSTLEAVIAVVRANSDGLGRTQKAA